MDDDAQHPITDRSVHSPFLSPGAQIEVTKRNLPHWQFDGGLYFVTFRLADSLPQELLRPWLDEKRAWLQKHPKPWDAFNLEQFRRLFPRRMDAWLDAGYGKCALREPTCAAFVAEAMLKFDGERYDVASFVVMPNHVHALFQLRDNTQLDRVLKAWKGVSARNINLHLGQSGALWQQESRDTSLRDPGHLIRCYAYILENPEKAHLREGEYLYYEASGLAQHLRP